MLTELDTRRRPPAYPVPWRIDRADPAHPLVSLTGREPCDFVRVFVADEVRPVSTENWGLVLPDEVCELCLCDRDLTRVLVSLSWYRPGEDREYLWRFSI
ncbi:MAG: hypothetical protein QM607_09765 [Microbacterium sp.]